MACTSRMPCHRDLSERDSGPSIYGEEHVAEKTIMEDMGAPSRMIANHAYREIYMDMREMKEYFAAGGSIFYYAQTGAIASTIVLSSNLVWLTYRLCAGYWYGGLLQYEAGDGIPNFCGVSSSLAASYLVSWL